MPAARPRRKPGMSDGLIGAGRQALFRFASPEGHDSGDSPRGCRLTGVPHQPGRNKRALWLETSRRNLHAREDGLGVLSVQSAILSGDGKGAPHSDMNPRGWRLHGKSTCVRNAPVLRGEELRPGAFSASEIRQRNAAAALPPARPSRIAFNWLRKRQASPAWLSVMRRRCSISPTSAGRLTRSRPICANFGRCWRRALIFRAW
jgi:hypothetical protein